MEYYSKPHLEALSSGQNDTYLKKYWPYLVLLLVISACSTSKKTAALWEPAESNEQSVVPDVLPNKFELYQLDLSLLTESLSQAGNTQDQGIFVQFPGPDGDMHNFKVWQSSVVSEAMLEKYPSLRAYQGFDLSLVSTSIRLELPEKGLQAMVRSGDDTWYIAPFDKNQELYMIFYKSDFPFTSKFWEGRIK